MIYVESTTYSSVTAPQICRNTEGETMSNLSQSERVIEVLKKHPLKKFNVRQIAEMVANEFFEDYAEKRKNTRFKDVKSFILQIAAEIGGQKDEISRKDAHVCWQDKPRPRVFWYDPENTMEQVAVGIEEDGEEETEVVSVTEAKLSEHDLYPVLISYLKSELGLYCKWIDDRTSSNSQGKGVNHWLHPDIVAMQPVDKDWHAFVKSCVKDGSGQRVRLWSFEVKMELSKANARQSYFQAVSNSSWANEGYLVATSIATPAVEQELRMLSALHGIGVILLNPENPSESDMILPAKSRAEVDWQSANRIVEENRDFREYIELISAYYSSSRLFPRDWNKI
jgi:hypothetical protein